MSGGKTITDETWKMLFEAQTDLVGFYSRVSRLPREAIEDCVSQGMIDVVSAYDAIAVATEANRHLLSERTVLHSMLKRAAELHIGRERRRGARLISDDTPIGEEDGELHFRDLFVPRQNTAERIENYAEWMMFARKGGCPLTRDEINDLFGIVA